MSNSHIHEQTTFLILKLPFNDFYCFRLKLWVRKHHFQIIFWCNRKEYFCCSCTVLFCCNWLEKFVAVTKIKIKLAQVFCVCWDICYICNIYCKILTFLFNFVYYSLYKEINFTQNWCNNLKFVVIAMVIFRIVCFFFLIGGL